MVGSKYFCTYCGFQFLLILFNLLLRYSVPAQDKKCQKLDSDAKRTKNEHANASFRTKSAKEELIIAWSVVSTFARNVFFNSYLSFHTSVAAVFPSILYRHKTNFFDSGAKRTKVNVGTYER